MCVNRLVQNLTGEIHQYWVCWGYVDNYLMYYITTLWHPFCLCTTVVCRDKHEKNWNVRGQCCTTQHKTDDEAVSTAVRLIVIPGVWEVKPTGTLSHDYSFTADRRKLNKYCSRIHVITGSDMGSGLSFTQPSNEGWLFSALCRCNARNMNQKKDPCQKVPLQWYHIKKIWFNLWHLNSPSDPTCRAVTQAHQGWFPCLSIAGFCKPLSFLGLLKHIIQLSTLSSERKGYPLLNATEYRLPL